MLVMMFPSLATHDAITRSFLPANLPQSYFDGAEEPIAIEAHTEMTGRRTRFMAYGCQPEALDVICASLY